MTVTKTVAATIQAPAAHKYVSSSGDDWYTPPEVFGALGLQFDLDPCAPPGGVPWLPAARHYSLEDGDGLALPWNGRVWLNPPYGGNTAAWVRRLAEHGNGVALVHSLTETRWMAEALASCDMVAFHTGRIYFIRPSGERHRGRPAAFLAWGGECADALRASGLGICLRGPA